MKRRPFLGILLLSFSLTLLQCSGVKTVSSQIKFEVIPKSPIVILSDFTLNPGDDNEKVIKAPWFLLNYSVSNDSDQDITIQSLLFHVTAMSTNGTIKTTTVTIDPADYKITDTHFLEEVAAHTQVTPAYGLYVHGLDEDVISYSYSVKVEIQGWVGTATEPVDRLNKTKLFNTK